MKKILKTGTLAMAVSLAALRLPVATSWISRP
mgnify:CR=1 FL=1